MKKTIAWFSSGVSSAIALYLMRKEVDLIMYIHIEDQHKDTIRFLSDIERLIGKEINILYPYHSCVQSACLSASFINSPQGASCTRLLKRRTREQWESDFPTVTNRYIWGFDINEKNRASDIMEAMPYQDHIFPLIDHNLSKQNSHGILKTLGIKRPYMYDLGYPNNNCIGCVKGGKGYWNKIRIDFPHIFEQRATMERKLNHSCINGCFLDDLERDSGRKQKVILEDCGIYCEIIK